MIEAKQDSEEVEQETINAYRVQKLSNGNVRIKSGGYVVTAPTYFEALEKYAQYNQEQIEEHLPAHLRERERKSIYDGYIPLYGFDSTGFHPEEILDAVTMHSLETVLDDLALNCHHGDYCSCYECEGDDE